MRKMNRSPKVILLGLTTLFLTVFAGPGVLARSEIEKQVDSLFVIASSGEVRYRDMVEPAKDAIAALGTDAVPCLIDKFTTRSAREQWTVLRILERIGTSAVPDLVRALGREDGRVVQRVCWALGNIRDSGAVEGLIGVGNHPRWQVRDQAVSALGKIGDQRGADVVIKALDDTVGQVRKSAVVSAGQLRLQQSAEKLVGLLGDDFYGARLSAVNSLLELDTHLVVAVVADSLESEDEYVGNLGCDVLGMIGTDRAMELLVAQVTSPNPNRRAHAAISLVKADPLDNCGYRQMYLFGETDRLVRLKIESALSALQDER